MLAATPPSKRPAPLLPKRVLEADGCGWHDGRSVVAHLQIPKAGLALAADLFDDDRTVVFGDLTLLPIFHLVIRSTG